MTTKPRLYAVSTPAPRVYTPEFRAEAVARVGAGEPVAGVARDVGVARNTLKSWIRHADAEPAPRAESGVVDAAASGSLRDTLVALRTEVASRIDSVANRDLPAYARLLVETMRDIAAIDEAEQTAEPVDDEPLNPEDI